MIVVTLARKPVTDIVAQNAVLHGTGGLNINETRIGTSKRVPATVSRGNQGIALSGSANQSLRRETGVEGGHNPNLGRWPANLILEHKAACAVTGTRIEPGYKINRWNDGAKPFGGGAGHPFTSNDIPETEVPVWTCVEGCPAKGVDVQSGDVKGQTTSGKKAGTGYSGNWPTAPVAPSYADSGGASRFFKQVGGQDS